MSFRDARPIPCLYLHVHQWVFVHIAYISGLMHYSSPILSCLLIYPFCYDNCTTDLHMSYLSFSNAYFHFVMLISQLTYIYVSVVHSLYDHGNHPNCLLSKYYLYPFISIVMATPTSSMYTYCIYG